MKIVFVSAWYSENMGYLENCLPQSLARLGHEVHLVTSTAQVYFNHPYYEKAYQKYLGDPIQPAGTKNTEGVTIHRLPFRQLKSKIIFKGLFNKIAEIRPDVVHTLEHVAIDTLKLALMKPIFRYKLFTANHAVMSVYPFARNWATLPFKKKVEWFLTEYCVGKFNSFFIEKCFAVTIDAGEIAEKYRGVPKNKVKVTTLGVDTHHFSPNEAAKYEFRKRYGYSEKDIICIYTGKLIAQKQPLLIAQAVHALYKQGLPYKAFFVAEGELGDEIRRYDCCQIIPLQPFKELPNFFRMADIAIWAGEESSSQLDAVASGACLILTDNIKAYDEIDLNPKPETQNPKPEIVSRKFQHGNLNDLIKQLEYLGDKNIRNALIIKGVEEMQSKYSWDKIAQNRLEDYNA
jgi:glycosyltransferase involved in cell wall biosynthesis